jgi:uncharacterized protein YaiE (UPF0345 family)
LAAGDASFASVKSLLHFDGADAATSVTDILGKTWTFTGNAQLDTAQVATGSASLLLDGTGDWISTPDHADFEVGSGDFSIDIRVRLNSVTGNHHILGKYGGAATSPFAIYQTANAIGFYASANGTTWGLVSNQSLGTGLVVNTWYRLTVVRSGNNWYTFRDGTLIATTTASGTVLDNAGAVTIGSNGTGTENFDGWIGEWRFTKGAARDTATFTDGGRFGDHVPLVASSLEPTTTFGTPVAIYNQTQTASSIEPATQVPTPAAAWDQVATASSIEPATQFGTPAVLTRCVASSIRPATVVSMAFYAFGQTLTASSIEPRLKFPKPVAIRQRRRPVA